MSTIAQPEIPCRVTGGVDTHKDFHVAAALDQLGRLLEIAEFPATAAGYTQLRAWLANHGEIDAVGIEGCGSWARAWPVEALRQLRVARAGARKARTAAANQLHSLLDTAPDHLRAQFAKLTFKQKITLAERFRPGNGCDNVETSTKRALRSVARRWRFLDDEARSLHADANTIIDAIAPRLVARHGVGYDTAGQLLITAGDNPERLHSEKSFAALCASTPVLASSGRTNRHRLNRGGDRHANSALWTIVLVRMGTDPRTKAYVAKRTADGLSKREIMRCLKRYVARELYPLILDVTTAQHTNHELESAA